MSGINLLPKNVSELIAAGEVVERPASVIKELVENSIDAESTAVTVEIQRGGITFIRITDNGCGIPAADVPKAFLRHATSKIRKESDLETIATLGFRGEALAAVSSVAKVEMLTCTHDGYTGTHYVIEGGEEKVLEGSGCPAGTTIIVRDIFYNTPARMKFLKKDVSEANACGAVVERIALSHPEIAFKCIRDGKLAFSTPGDSDIKGCIYSVLGRDFANSLIEVDSVQEGVKVKGFITKPVFCRPTRSGQYTFLNGRLIRSGTITAAAEQAYKNSAMTGKFPGFVIYLTLPFNTVDVNVHPAKTEVRFSDERRVFDAVYSAVKNSLLNNDTRPEIRFSSPVFNPFSHITAAEYRQQKIEGDKTIAEQIYSKKPAERDYVHLYKGAAKTAAEPCRTEGLKNPSVRPEPEVFSPEAGTSGIPGIGIRFEAPPEIQIVEKSSQGEYAVSQKTDDLPELCEDFSLIGEAFSTYIIVQTGDSVYFIDKHAAHERILYNKYMKEQHIEVQSLLTPITAVLPAEEYDALTGNTGILEKSGFEIEDFGNFTVIVRAVPAMLAGEDISGLLSEIAEDLSVSDNIVTDRQESIFHSVACKAAVKAGSRTSREEMLSLARRVLTDRDVMYCPHGRPVAYEIKKRELEKQFGRIQ